MRARYINSNQQIRHHIKILMNYATDPLWQHFAHPAVRTLAALLTAPPPWQSGCEITVADLLGEGGFRLLEQWDRQPENPLPAPMPQMRLGKYAEALLACWFAHAPHTRLIAAEYPVRQPENGRTLGAFDFVVEIGGTPCHLELCCKYYGGGQPENMAGFDPADTLAAKSAALPRQLALSESPEGRAALLALGVCPDHIRRASVVRGMLFTPDGNPPPSCLPQVWTGRLIRSWNGYRPGRPDTRFYFLPRCAYPAPARVSFAETLDSDTVFTTVSQGLVAEMHPAADGFWHESTRLMLRGF